MKRKNLKTGYEGKSAQELKNESRKAIAMNDDIAKSLFGDSGGLHEFDFSGHIQKTRPVPVDTLRDSETPVMDSLVYSPTGLGEIKPMITRRLSR